MSKPYDIAVFGASGFTGQLVARYLASKTHDEGFKLVAVGRNADKVKQRMKEVGVTADVLVADSTDENSLRDVLKQVKVVASLVISHSLSSYISRELSLSVHDRLDHICSTESSSIVCALKWAFITAISLVSRVFCFSLLTPFRNTRRDHSATTPILIARSIRR